MKNIVKPFETPAPIVIFNVMLVWLLSLQSLHYRVHRLFCLYIYGLVELVLSGLLLLVKTRFLFAETMSSVSLLMHLCAWENLIIVLRFGNSSTV